MIYEFILGTLVMAAILLLTCACPTWLLIAFNGAIGGLTAIL
jgi:hypothetical protein